MNYVYDIVILLNKDEKLTPILEKKKEELKKFIIDFFKLNDTNFIDSIIFSRKIKECYFTVNEKYGEYFIFRINTLEIIDTDSKDIFFDKIKRIDYFLKFKIVKLSTFFKDKKIIVT